MSLLAKVEVVNLAARGGLHADEVAVVVECGYPPEQVERVLLEALRDLDGISPAPAPETRLLAFDGQGIRYAVRFWITDFGARDAILTAVHRALWYHFRRANICFACPATAVTLRRPAPAAAAGARVALLRAIPFLQSLSPEQMQQLADRLHPALFASGETICRQGEAGQTFYVIARGHVRVTASDDEGREVFSHTLQAGEFFGEFSLLTGEPRSATVVAEGESELLVMGKDAMRQALDATPRLAEHISAVLAARQHELRESRARVTAAAGPAAAPQTVESLQRELLRRIVDFFAY